MAQLLSISLADLSTAERAEVEAAIKPPHGPKFLADNNDVFALWIFLVLAGAGGIGVYFFGGIPIPYAREALALVGIGLIGWTVSTAMRTYGKRGCLSTSFGTFLVRGSKLKGVRHADVKEIKRRVIVTRTQRFTVFELVTKEGQKLTMYAHAGWAETAIAGIQQVNGGTIPVGER